MLHPLTKEQWNSIAAKHLLSRAGFDGTPSEINKLTEGGVEKAVAQLLDFNRIADTAPLPSCALPDPNRKATYEKLRAAGPDEKMELKKAVQREAREKMLELQYWWLQKMATGPHPLQEKLTLFWHGHFATSATKVKEPNWMWRQNEIFRKYAAGNWATLLIEVSKDPAMLLWLDGNQNRAGKPNENFAREVMELFTLGEGHYSEKDIQEAAKAFTGWQTDRVSLESRYRPRLHDSSLKTVLGKTGNLTGEEVLAHLAQQPQSARFITNKLWYFFAGTPASEALQTAMAQKFQEGKGEIRPFLQTLFTSQEFYEKSVINQQVKSPIQWLIGTCRTLQRPLPPAVVCINLLNQLGQVPLAPPNVKGWDGGISWITTANLLNRYNFAALLVEGINVTGGKAPPPPMEERPPGEEMMTMETPAEENPQVVRNKGKEARLERKANRVADQVQPSDVEKIFSSAELSDKKKFIEAIQSHFLILPIKESRNAAILTYLEEKKTLTPEVARHAIRLLMSTPEYQLN